MNKRYLLPAFISSVFFLWLFSCSDYGNNDILREGFINPPDSARPGVFWYFVDGNIDMKAITADLESMKKAGIGYVLLRDVTAGFPSGNTELLSERWLNCFHHAVKECERLGIRLILGSGPGLNGNGGPWITPEESMMNLVASDTILTGPASFISALPLPKPHKIFSGENGMTPEMNKARNDWYKDVRILAFPTPSGDERIKDIDSKAFYYTPSSTSGAEMAPYIPISVKYPETIGSVVQKEKIIDLTNYLRSDGKLEWLVPPGKWTVIRMGARNNGEVTIQAPVSGYGFLADKFDTAALRSHYDAFEKKLLSNLNPVNSTTGGGWTMIHFDGRNIEGQNWSNGFVEQFIKRRGYDPMLFLPAIEGYIVNSTMESERFLWDVRQTINELVIENHAGYLRKLGQQNGFTLSIDPNNLNLSAGFDMEVVADVPMASVSINGYGSNSLLSCIESSSVAHITGKPVVAAKAFIADNQDAWKNYPGETKNQADWALAMGINRIMFHSFIHKYPGDQFLPGMALGQSGIQWDRGQTWWPMVSEYHKYLSRCQLVLSQGNYVADILYLAPEGAPQAFMPPRSSFDNADGLPDKKGYSFDVCSPKYFIANASVVRSRISFPDGTSYRILVLPDIKTMTPELLSKIDMIIRMGGFIVGYPPVISPSLSGYPASDRNILEMTQKMWGLRSEYAENTWKPYSNGTIFTPKRTIGPENEEGTREFYPEYSVTAAILDSLGIKEDFNSSGNIRYIHRALQDREIYFISNRTDKIIEDSCLFRDGTTYAELWDPVTGETRPVRSSVTLGPKVARVKIRMEPRQSFFIVFYHEPTRNLSRFKNGDDFPVKKEILKLKGPWKAEFSKSWGGPGVVVFDTLSDWTSRQEEGIRFYSGTVPYSIDFSLPENVDPEGPDNIFLNLGTVANLARIKLNGKDLGVVWTSPMEVKINKYVKKKDNQLIVEVTNLWINRLIGDESKPWDGVENGKWPEWLTGGATRKSGRYTFTTVPSCKKDDPLLSSGLIGPVRIMTTGR